MVLVLSAVFTVAVSSTVIFWIIYREVIRNREAEEASKGEDRKPADHE